MRASLQWLNELLDRPITRDEAADRLTLAGFPVESWGTTTEGDEWLEVELTSNRGDCLCHLGLAREIAAATGRIARDPAVGAAETLHTAAPPADGISVTTEEPAACPLYTATVVRGIRVGPSPDWMQSRLRAIGQIPRNNVVDCTNYVLFELGQPTHVFDLAKLSGPAIVIRRAREGETIVPIGEGAGAVELRPSDLVIADATVPAAVAGVKGGALSAVTDSTTDVLVESATFDPRAVRAASRGLGLSSDSAYRFERGVDAGQVRSAAMRLVQLIVQTAGGQWTGPTACAGLPPAPERTVSMRTSRCAAVLGSPVGAQDIVPRLEPLGLRPTVDGDLITCTIPPARVDLEREVDLIEEVARLRGHDAIPVRDSITVRAHAMSPLVAATRAAKDLLAGIGYLETVTHTLVTERTAAAFTPASAGTLRLDDDRALAPILRPSLLGSLLDVLATNVDRAGDRPPLFEVSRGFTVRGNQHHEPILVGILQPGSGDPAACYRALRGTVDRLVFTLTGQRPLVGASGTCTAFAPGTPILLGNRALGHIGLLSRQALKSAGVDGPIAAAELEILESLEVFPPDVRVKALPTMPSSERDLSLVVADAVTWTEVESHVLALGLQHLECVRFVSTFRGEQIGADRKSVTIRLAFRAPDRTLKREEADSETARALGSLRIAFGAEVRA